MNLKIHAKCKVTNGGQITIPKELISGAALDSTDHAYGIPATGALVLMKGKITAEELLNTALDLQQIAADMLTDLALYIGEKDDCTEVDSGDSEDALYIPVKILEAAGITPGAKLHISADGNDGTITIRSAEPQPEELPTELAELFRGANVCYKRLMKAICDGEVIYE